MVVVSSFFLWIIVKVSHVLVPKDGHYLILFKIVAKVLSHGYVILPPSAPIQVDNGHYMVRC